MDLLTLQLTIAGALNGTKFDLAGTSLGVSTDPVPALLEAWFQSPHLELTGATVEAAGAQSVARGALASLPLPGREFLSGMGVVATFGLDSGNTPHVRITFTPARAGNGLPDLLPGLKNTILASFVWKGSRFHVDSQRPAALPLAFPSSYDAPRNSDAVLGALQRGMSFEATVGYAGTDRGIDRGIDSLFGGADIAIAGPIEWYQASPSPRFDLASATFGTSTLGPFSLPCSLHLVGLLVEPSPVTPEAASVVPTSFAIVTGDLGLPAQAPALDLPFNIQVFADPPGQITAVAKPAKLAALTLDGVAALLGATSLASEQPKSSFPSLSTGLALQTVKLSVDVARWQLLEASAELSFTPAGGAWAPFGLDLLVFRELIIAFSVLDLQVSPWYYTTLSATAELAGGALAAQVRLPSLDFACDLEPGSPPIDLTEILSRATGGAFGSSFKALCTELSLLGNPAESWYRMRAAVSGDHRWAFDALGAKFELRNVGFDLTVQTGASSTTGHVMAQMLVADVPVTLSADYLGAAGGWAFLGSTTDEVTLSLADLARAASATFGVSLPVSVPRIAISKLELMVATSNMDFAFGCDGAISLMGTTVDLAIDLARIHDDPTQPTSVTTTFAGHLTIAGQEFTADFTSAGNVARFVWRHASDDHGEAAGGSSLDVRAIASFFHLDFPSLPGALEFDLLEASLEYEIGTGAFHFTAISGAAWAILGNALVIDRLSLDVSGGSGAGRTTGSLGGEVTIAGSTVELTATVGQKGVRFSGATAKGQEIKLTALAGHLGLTGSLPADVPDVAIADLALTFDTADKSFSFHGVSSAEWPLTIAGKAVAMAVAVDVERGAGAAKPTVTVTGSFTIGSTTFMIAHTVGSPTLVARWGDLQLELSKGPSESYTFKLRSLPLGEALARLVAMADPNFTLALEPPWDRLASFTLPEIELTVDTTAHAVGFRCPVSINLGAGTISGIAARFEKDQTVVLDVQGDFLGQTLPSWDLVNQPPPALPSAAPRALDVRYLGLGQHVALTTTSDLTSVGKVIEALRTVPVAQDPTSSLHDLKFDASAGWLIGFDLSIKGAIRIAAIFNDPALYGLKIELSGDMVGKLKGLSFEILYRKIADGLGLYHIDLLLPLLLRHLQFGSVSLTLPHVIVDIYTNGNFLVDFGFPYERDFSRSMMIEIFPFVGAGGFYFGVLDSSTSNLVPTPQSGAFQPVIAFGLGLQVGLGKTFEAGPLSAGITITVEGILEGVLAFWKNDHASETYFKLSGTVAISAHVWGSVDFVIVSASIDIYVFAAVQLVIESHQPIFLELSAGVSVSASARVCGLFKVHFHFSTTIHESFTIGSRSQAPWELS